MLAARKHPRRPWIIAHRGVPHEAPENTLPGFELAIRYGADFVELDVHQSADRQLVVIHDETVDRTTNGSGRISDLTLSAIQRLSTRDPHDHGGAPARVPTLNEVLEATAGRAGLVIEIKFGTARYPAIESQVVAEIERLDRVDDAIIISDDQDVIRAVRERNPSIATLNFHDRFSAPESWDLPRTENTTRTGAFVFAWPRECEAAAVERARSRGVGVLSSVLSHQVIPEDAVRAVVLARVDGIFTDDVQQLGAILACVGC